MTPDGLLLAVRATPRGGRDAVDGVMTGADGRAVLRVRLAAPPVEGAANTALVAFLAKRFGLAKADVSIRLGETARVKLVELRGDPQALAVRIEALVAR